MVVIMGAAGDRVGCHLAVHVEIGKPRPGETQPKKTFRTMLCHYGKSSMLLTHNCSHHTNIFFLHFITKNYFICLMLKVFFLGPKHLKLWS